VAKKPPTPGSSAWWTQIGAHPQTKTGGGFGVFSDPRVQAKYGFPGFKPYRPPDPAGYYDPALNAQLGAAHRGYGDTQDDISLAGTRAAADYGIQDSLYKTAVGNENDQYNRNVGLLTKNYTDLQANQEDQANAYGVVPGGGAALQSAAKRAANQATDQAGLDLSHNEALKGLQDQWDQFGLNYNRGITDRTTALTRAGRENTQFGIDTTHEKAFQADQAGYIAPKPPKGQQGGVITPGVPRRTITAGGYAYTVDQHGKVLHKKRVK
jgi:hypothetical protein